MRLFAIVNSDLCRIGTGFDGGNARRNSDQKQASLASGTIF